MINSGRRGHNTTVIRQESNGSNADQIVIKKKTIGSPGQDQRVNSKFNNHANPSQNSQHSQRSRGNIVNSRSTRNGVGQFAGHYNVSKNSRQGSEARVNQGSNNEFMIKKNSRNFGSMHQRNNAGMNQNLSPTNQGGLSINVNVNSYRDPINEVRSP